MRAIDLKFTIGSIICLIAFSVGLKLGNDVGYKKGIIDGERHGFSVAMDTMTQIATNQIKSDTTVSKVIVTTKDTIVFNLSAKTCLMESEPAR